MAITFSNWISEKLHARIFLQKANQFKEIEQLLKTETVEQKRTKLVNELYQLENT